MSDEHKVNCFNCTHYRQGNLDNECMITRDYCYPAHKVKNCLYYEYDKNGEGNDGTLLDDV